MKCRNCGSSERFDFLNLGSSPPSNAYVHADQKLGVEKWFPLHVVVCAECFLVQTCDYTSREELFTADYAYHSSVSLSWLNHCQKYTEMVAERFKLSQESMVIEIAANDGYLLQFFKQKKIPSIGIEPTASTAQIARQKGIQIIEEFFGDHIGERLSDRGMTADLVIANNVLAHVPDIKDFLSGIQKLLKPDGVATFEFPSVTNLISKNQFDTIYHEHFSYLSLNIVSSICESLGLVVFDVEEIETHGGSLRVFAKLSQNETNQLTDRVHTVLSKELSAGIHSEAYYSDFQRRVEKIKLSFLSFLIDKKRCGESVVGYGAAAKANTLLNYAGVRSDLINCVFDKNQAKQGMYLPGSKLPILPDSEISIHKPDYIIVFPWNIKEEIKSQLDPVNDWGGKFVTFIPELEIF